MAGNGQRPSVDGVKAKTVSRAREVASRARPALTSVQSRAKEVPERARPVVDAARTRATGAVQRARPLAAEAGARARQAAAQARPVLDATVSRTRGAVQRPRPLLASVAAVLWRTVAATYRTAAWIAPRAVRAGRAVSSVAAKQAGAIRREVPRVWRRTRRGEPPE